MTDDEGREAGGVRIYGETDDDGADEFDVPVYGTTETEDDDDDDFDIPVYGDTDTSDDEPDLDGIAVGVADYAVTDRPRTLSTSGVGSCVGLAVYDDESEVAGLLHFMLPTADESRGRHHPDAKFADTGLEAMLADMTNLGAELTDAWAKFAGGATMVDFETDGRPVGERNVDAIEFLLDEHGISLVATDTGGRSGRTITFEPQTEELLVRTAVGTEKRL